MNYNSLTLRALDAHYIFNGLVNLSIIVLVIIVAKVVLDKPGWFPKRLKNITWVFVAILCIAIAAQYATDLYGYVHSIRPFYVQARQNMTGL